MNIPAAETPIAIEIGAPNDQARAEALEKRRVHPSRYPSPRKVLMAPASNFRRSRGHINFDRIGIAVFFLGIGDVRSDRLAKSRVPGGA